jgi:hypothetical protein
MRRLLMTVQAAFDLSHVGATLVPALPAAALTPPYPERVVLKRPDGREIETRARFSMTHFNRPYSERTIESTWMLVVALVDLGKSDIAAGAEVWFEEPYDVKSSVSPA